jgi:hypothetical protein
VQPLNVNISRYRACIFGTPSFTTHVTLTKSTNIHGITISTSSHGRWPSLTNARILLCVMYWPPPAGCWNHGAIGPAKQSGAAALYTPDSFTVPYAEELWLAPLRQGLENKGSLKHEKYIGKIARNKVTRGSARWLYEAPAGIKFPYSLPKRPSRVPTGSVVALDRLVTLIEMGAPQR